MSAPDQATGPIDRPTNYWRNAYHVANALLVVYLVQEWFTETVMVGVAAGCVALAFTMETTRRVSPAINAALMRLFGRVAHPHEAHQVNSATWYVTALLVLALAFDPLPGCLGVAVLGVGDPMAAIVGKRWGRVRLLHGRSLEGSLTFVLTGALAAATVLWLWHPDRPWLLPSLSAALCGAMAELLAGRVDDNFAIPIAGAIGASLVM